MSPFCELNLEGRPHRLDVLHLHRYFFRHDNGTPHAHPYFHFILVARGRCDLILDGGFAADCPRHALVMINPNHGHMFRSDHEGAEHVSLIAAFRDRAGRAFTGSVQSLFGGAAEGGERHRVALLQESVAGAFAHRHHVAMALREGEREAAAEAAVLELFFMGARLALPELFSVPVPRSRSEEIIAQIRFIVEDQLHDANLSLGKIAEQFNFSKNHLNLLFRRATGNSIGEYIIRCRLQRACQLLQSHFRVKDVAARCGFTRENRFSDLFKQRIGCRPSVYAAQTASPHCKHTLPGGA